MPTILVRIVLKVMRKCISKIENKNSYQIDLRFELSVFLFKIEFSIFQFIHIFRTEQHFLEAARSGDINRVSHILAAGETNINCKNV